MWDFLNRTIKVIGGNSLILLKVESTCCEKPTADASILLPENRGTPRHAATLIAAVLLYPGGVSINSVALAGSVKYPRSHTHIFPAIDGFPALLGDAVQEAVYI